MAFKQARREQIPIKVLLGGPSGSGKTFSALKLATGISKQLKKPIAVIDTENKRSRYYAREFDFYDVDIEAPYTPEKYIALIDEAIEEGFGVLVLDSLSHEWDYILDVHQKMPGNSYTNWAKLTPRHDALMEKILQSPIHIIATVRGKDEYVLEEKDGKQVPKKVGLGYKQRDNIEYNYTVTCNLDQTTNIANPTKDNTHLFENRYEKLTEKDGENLYIWANDGDVVAPKLIIKKAVEPTVDEIKEVIDAIDSLSKEILDKKYKSSDELKELLESMITNDKGKKTYNYKAITDMSTARKVHDELMKLIPSEQ